MDRTYYGTDSYSLWLNRTGHLLHFSRHYTWLILTQRWKMMQDEEKYPIQVNDVGKMQRITISISSHHNYDEDG